MNPAREEELPIATKSELEMQKHSIMDAAWLKYYNQVLFEKGLITEEERNRMLHRIDQAHPAPKKKRVNLER